MTNSVKGAATHSKYTEASEHPHPSSGCWKRIAQLRRAIWRRHHCSDHTNNNTIPISPDVGDCLVQRLKDICFIFIITCINHFYSIELNLFLTWIKGMASVDAISFYYSSCCVKVKMVHVDKVRQNNWLLIIVWLCPWCLRYNYKIMQIMTLKSFWKWQKSEIWYMGSPGNVSNKNATTLTSFQAPPLNLIDFECIYSLHIL